MTVLIKTTLAIEIMYYVLIFCVKVSILFFYLRIGMARTSQRESVLTSPLAANKSFELGCKATIYFLAVFTVVCVIACVTQCVPLHKMWDFLGVVQGHCINTTALFYCKCLHVPRLLRL